MKPLPPPPGLRITHDAEGNVAYIYLADRRVAGRSHRCDYALGSRAVVDFDAQDRLLGIELLDARGLLRPEVLERASRPPYQHLEPLDREVLDACAGDRCAIERLCRKHQAMLRLEAASALGFARRHQAEGVVQSLRLALAAGNLRFPMIRGAGLSWLRRAIRELAAGHVPIGGGR
jgi:uncharacterized protein YuzE